MITLFGVFVPPPSGASPEAHQAVRSLFTAVFDLPAARYVARRTFDGPSAREEALQTAFAAAASLDRAVGRLTFALAAGDDDRGFRLAIGLDRDLVPHTIEVLATPGFMAGFAPPPGIGAFLAPGHGHGNVATVLVDYRH